MDSRLLVRICELFLVVLCLSTVCIEAELEPSACSRFDYEDKLLTKVVKLSVAVEKIDETLGQVGARLTQLEDAKSVATHTPDIGKTGGTCQERCLDTWTYYNGSCYLFADTIAVQWMEAMRYCKMPGAHLAEVGSADEGMFLQEYSRRLFRTATDDSFWLGATDMDVEGEWTWYTDKSPVIYSNWNKGQPEKLTSQDCAILYGQKEFKWHDTECSTLRHPLCEVRLC